MGEKEPNKQKIAKEQSRTYRRLEPGHCGRGQTGRATPPLFGVAAPPRLEIEGGSESVEENEESEGSYGRLLPPSPPPNGGVVEGNRHWTVGGGEGASICFDWLREATVIMTFSIWRFLKPIFYCWVPLLPQIFCRKWFFMLWLVYHAS